MRQVPATLEELQAALTQALPAFSYQIIEPASYLLVKQSRLSGAEVRIRGNKLLVSFSIPIWQRVVQMNENAMLPILIRLFVWNAFRPVQQVAGNLQVHYREVHLHLSGRKY